MNKDKLKRSLISIGKDILVAFVIVCLVMLIIFAYCGIWPPMVVVESGSMQRHDNKSVVGVIDTGDMVFVKTVNGIDDVTTYVDGEATDYSKYGAYGDVIIYRPNGQTEMEDGTAIVPIIHRLVVWLEVNETKVSQDFVGIDYVNYTFDVPSLCLYGTRDAIILEDYGFWKESVVINLEWLMLYYETHDKVPHGGYITMGDNNVPFYDQPNYELILPEWIVGKAIGEIPWFGLIKLKVTGSNTDGVPRNSWTGLYITIFLLLFLPFVFDMVAPRLSKYRARRKELKTGAEEKDEKTHPPAKPDNTLAEKPPGEAETTEKGPDGGAPGSDVK
ncbi:MAG: S26 family signal peptidase [Candidatus Thermoplasmatota archaeon]|nr:S26 family signal peptidase [Euryarchaeota archaeon]MBU4031406.1 S26 family signal peptidase [Candidatus Thermoplasmatota archaeon]MBU4071319.1 S26 family signal peptidase [Candidatus Thermoplasmatota archaeon]MBU4143376.1 S26 family signal peptidase [Candidatus Thermoplasmatota archaeon]MBU4591202.1 S26 family signal peptidase [Candidatus Thermoplasmatota archaeon]